MSIQGKAADAGSRGRMRVALRDAVTRGGGVRRVSGVSLMAVLCASAVAPVVLVGQEVGPVLAAWLATAGSVGSNLLADVITNVAGRREATDGLSASGVEQAVAVALEARMAAPSGQAAVLRGEVAGLLRERGAQQVLVEALAEGDGDVREVLAEAMVLLLGQFEEFTGLFGSVREGVGELLVAALGQQIENEAQEQHRREVRGALERILRLLQDGSASPGGTGVVYSMLPPDTAAFTGRGAEIREIIGRVEAAAEHGGVVAIHAIDGMPGVGKTALAVHVAHRLAARFSDLQVFVDLHAHTVGQSPADSSATLASLLIGDGVDPRQLPTSLEDLSSLWRARMAARRALVVLDNAADSAQVAPLLPGGRECLVLITSRRHIGDLPYAVTDISLDVLPPEEAAAMFLRLCPRAAGQQEQVAHLVALAGYLPLAIALLARVHARHRTWAMSDLLRETRARLLTLTAENHTIAAAFDLSYDTLTAPRQRFFRLLSLHPGTDLDPYAAAALAATTLEQAAADLETLYGDHLLTEPGYHRYGMHDLIRAHARTLATAIDPAPDRQAAVDGLLHYYAHTAHTASRTIVRTPRPAPTTPTPVCAPDLPTAYSAQSWLRTEYPNLDAAFAHAATHHLDEHSVALAAGMAEILRIDGPWTRALDIHRHAADTTRHQNDPAAHANALTFLGVVLRLTGDLPRAQDAHTQALKIYREIGHRLGEASALIDLGLVLHLTGDLPRAQDALTRALEICREIGSRLGEASALTDLGVVLLQTGDLPRAQDAFTRALEIYREIGHRLGEADALNELGIVLRQTGDLPRAQDAFTRALEIHREIGHRLGEANALNELGIVLRQTGDLPRAQDAHTRALEIYRETGSRGNEAWALNHYAATIAALGDRPRAFDLYHQALAMNRELNKPDDEAISLEGLAEHHLATGDPGQGAAHLRQALEIYRRLGMRADTDRAQARLAALTPR